MTEDDPPPLGKGQPPPGHRVVGEFERDEEDPEGDRERGVGQVPRDGDKVEREKGQLNDHEECGAPHLVAHRAPGLPPEVGDSLRAIAGRAQAETTFGGGAEQLVEGGGDHVAGQREGEPDDENRGERQEEREEPAQQARNPVDRDPVPGLRASHVGPGGDEPVEVVEPECEGAEREAEDGDVDHERQERVAAQPPVGPDEAEGEDRVGEAPGEGGDGVPGVGWDRARGRRVRRSRGAHA